MLFRQNYCRKSQKGVYLHLVKSQKGVDMKEMNMKQAVITILLALVAMAGQAQTKTATKTQITFVTHSLYV